jgi:hypothetical protein
LWGPGPLRSHLSAGASRCGAVVASGSADGVGGCRGSPAGAGTVTLDVDQVDDLLTALPEALSGPPSAGSTWARR